MAKLYSDRVYKGTLTTSSVAAATIAAGTTFVPAGIVITNADASARKAEILWDGIRLLPYAYAIPSGLMFQAETPLPPLTTGKTIMVKGEVGSSMDYIIWGQDETSA